MSASDESGASSRALAIPDPSTKPGQMKLSNSLRSAARDEFVYVGRSGEVRPIWRYRAGRAIAITGAVGLGVAGIGLCFAVGAPFLSLLYVGALAIGGTAWRHGERLKAAAALVACYHRKQA